MFWPVFLIKSFSLFLDGTIYMEFQALCQVNIGNKKKEADETQITLSISINMAPLNSNFMYFFNIIDNNHIILKTLYLKGYLRLSLIIKITVIPLLKVK
jgi:hypothetical protein